MGLTKLLSEYKWKTYSGLHSSIIEATWETVQKFGKVYAITQCAYQSDLVSSEQALIRMWGNKEFETRASYIICWAPCTMKMKDLLFKKQEKVPSKVLCFFHGISLDSSYFFFFFFDTMLLGHRDTCWVSADPHRYPWPCPMTQLIRGHSIPAARLLVPPPTQLINVPSQVWGRQFPNFTGQQPQPQWPDDPQNTATSAPRHTQYWMRVSKRLTPVKSPT